MERVTLLQDEPKEVVRLPKNAVGDFYTTGQYRQDERYHAGGIWLGECLACELPEAEAPKLLAELNEDNMDTYFIKQPETDDEISQAIAATRVCCVHAVRYGGRDKAIIKRVNPRSRDYKITFLGTVVPITSPWWLLWWKSP